MQLLDRLAIWMRFSPWTIPLSCKIVVRGWHHSAFFTHDSMKGTSVKHTQGIKRRPLLFAFEPRTNNRHQGPLHARLVGGVLPSRGPLETGFVSTSWRPTSTPNRRSWEVEKAGSEGCSGELGVLCVLAPAGRRQGVARSQIRCTTDGLQHRCWQGLACPQVWRTQRLMPGTCWEKSKRKRIAGLGKV